jgi:hypothetical protein
MRKRDKIWKEVTRKEHERKEQIAGMCPSTHKKCK